MSQLWITLSKYPRNKREFPRSIHPIICARVYCPELFNNGDPAPIRSTRESALGQHPLFGTRTGKLHGTTGPEFKRPESPYRAQVGTQTAQFLTIWHQVMETIDLYFWHYAHFGTNRLAHTRYRMPTYALRRTTWARNCHSASRRTHRNVLNNIRFSGVHFLPHSLYQSRKHIVSITEVESASGIAVIFGH